MQSEKNKTTNSAKECNDKDAILTWRQQLLCFAIGIIIGSVLIACVVYIVCLIHWNEGSSICFSKILTISAFGGTFGGSLRALMMLIFEVGLKKYDRKPVDFYLSRWPLYLIKPFIGCGTGILFFLAVNFGLVKHFTKEYAPMILPIFFVSAVGGIFFEEVIAILGRFINTFSTGRTEKQLKTGQVLNKGEEGKGE